MARSIYFTDSCLQLIEDIFKDPNNISCIDFTVYSNGSVVISPRMKNLKG